MPVDLYSINFTLELNFYNINISPIKLGVDDDVFIDQSLIYYFHLRTWAQMTFSFGK